MARKGATTGQRRIYMPNMRDEGNPTTIQSRRDRKTVRSKQNSIGPSKKGDITFTITLSARIDEPSDNARPSPKRHDRSPPNFTGDLKTSFWSANPKDRTKKCLLREIDEEAQYGRRRCIEWPTNSKPQEGANTGGN
ncbi:unnamed protein product [Microthlaspi erraticum]|uniref:Uncharacterized protein n=2 Tax=Microthlaspi erraticum TaxID=1685480 RepID=A0A6D2IG11_9BRAS|nr:unnamed protein product [Microthlaspi erraticum]